jgi:hypothetical protein
MKPVKANLFPVVIALFVSGFYLGFAPAHADELPEDTNKIESLTPEQARKLAEDFLGVEIDVKGFGKRGVPGCLPLNGLKSLDAETARALAGYGKGPLPLNGLTTLDAETAKALVEFKSLYLFLSGLTTLDAATAKSLAESKAWNGDLSAVTAFDSPDSVAIAQALAAREGRLALTNLKKISPKTLSALIEKEDVEIPLIETLELIPEPDGSATEDLVIPEWLDEQQRQQRNAQAAK